MVKLVLDWAKARQEKEDDMFSNKLCAKLYQSYKILQTTLTQDVTEESFKRVKDLCWLIRSLIQQLSTESGVPIEPASSTSLLDGILNTLDYVSYAAVPGAGGNDAIFLIGRSPQTTESFHEIVQRDVCSKFKNEEEQQIAVLPVKVLRGEALIIETSR